MKRLYLLVEGQTEETFSNQTLVPYFYQLGFESVRVIVVATKRSAGGGKFSGGVSNWKKLQTDIRGLVADSGALVTTMIDFYGLPGDVPGFATMQPSWNSRQRVAHIETQLVAAVGSANFLPHVVLHETETLLYADPRAVGDHLNDPELTASMQRDLDECFEPELVNEGPNSAPSKRILKQRPGYMKTADGPSILNKIGLDRIRAACPHFDSWLRAIEAVAIGAA